MTSRKLTLFSALAILTLICWLVGNEMLLPASMVLATVMTVPYPASIVVGLPCEPGYPRPVF
jgi:hypothetical protein